MRSLIEQLKDIRDNYDKIPVEKMDERAAVRRWDGEKLHDLLPAIIRTLESNR